MLKSIYGLVFCLALLGLSCNKVQQKGQALVDKASEKVQNKASALRDRIAPRFDAYTPDTRYNKARFKDFLQVELSPDIKNIYCHNDAIGIDADYQFSFNCKPNTAQRIIEKHQLTLDSLNTDFAFGLQDDFDWWDKQQIEKLDLYTWHDGDQYFKYFWYDSQQQKAYFFDFDL